jgi:hypothetical protein
MRAAVLADIHGNLPGLEAVLGEALAAGNETIQQQAANLRTRKSSEEVLEAVSDRGRGVRSRGGRPPARGAPEPQEMMRDAVPGFRDL